MNKKTEILNNLRSAKSAHMKWKAHALALVQGLPLHESQVPIIHTDCAFGKWYYGAGLKLSTLDAYTALDKPHEQLHEVYSRIFKLLFGEEDRSLFSKLFGSKAKVLKHKTEAESLMKMLTNISSDVVGLMNRLEMEISAMSDEDVEALI